MSKENWGWESLPKEKVFRPARNEKIWGKLNVWVRALDCRVV